MWRGYGGNGKGAAIVFDSSLLEPKPDSPLVISKVMYGTRDARIAWINETLRVFSDLLKAANIPDEKLYIAAHAALERIKLMPIFSKHNGFHEEREWRFVYLRQRDDKDFLSGFLHYAINANGIEQKLKFKVSTFATTSKTEFSLEKLVRKIILGPSLATPIHFNSAKRMLELIGKKNLIEKLSASQTPYRSTGNP